MLTDAAIKALRPKDKIYKVADRDGMMSASCRQDRYPSGWTIG